MSNKKFDPTKPGQTRDGRPARILAHDIIGRFPIVAAINTGEIYGGGTAESVAVFSSNGTFCVSGQQSAHDLVNIPEKRTFGAWINIYPNGTGCINETRAGADRDAMSTRVACIKVAVVYTEGDGL